MDFSGHDDFYFRTLELVNAAVGVAAVIAALGLLVFLVEGIVSRRRTYTALVATGVPRRTLARTLSWQVLGPAVPAIALALAVGVTLPRAISRQESGGGYPMTVCTADDPSLCGSADSPHLEMVQIPTFVRPVELPVAELALVGGGALGAVLVTVAAARLFLRASTEVSELRTT